MNAADPRVIVALDFPDMLTAFGLAARLDPALCAVKVGKELFTGAEAGLVRELVRRGFSDDDISKILGGNLMRVFEKTWQSR